MRALLAILLPTLFFACDDTVGPCTDENVPSVRVTVLDINGDIFENPQVVFSSEGMGGNIFCDEYGPGEYVCGWETAGAIHIQAWAEGYGSEASLITVEEDECHVITEEVTLTLLAEEFQPN